MSDILLIKWESKFSDECANGGEFETSVKAPGGRSCGKFARVASRVEFGGLSKYNEPGPITSSVDDVYRQVEKETSDFDERYRI